MKGEIDLYFCKKCMVFTDARYWIHDNNSFRPKGKCSVCGTENKYKLIKFKVKDIERVIN